MFRNNKQGLSKPIPKIAGTTVKERSVSFLSKYGHDYNEWAEVANEQKIKPEAMFCIARSDSHLGYALKSKHNYGNVGNNDRGNTVAFKTRKDGIRAIGTLALNGRYLRHKQSIGSLSPGGGGERPYYATSKDNWNNNVLNCLSLIHGKGIEEDFIFRQ